MICKSFVDGKASIAHDERFELPPGKTFDPLYSTHYFTSLHNACFPLEFGTES